VARNTKKPAPAPATAWTFLTNHAHVLFCLAADPKATMRAVAARVGITERAVQRIIAELAATGCVTITRVGRQNEYEVQPEAPLRGPFADGRTVGHLLKLAS
jgi:hypothetical protein